MVKEKLRVEILNGALEDYKQYMAGRYKGFYIVVNFQSPYYIVNIHATAPNEEGYMDLQAFLPQYQKSMKQLAKAELKKNEIILSIATPNLMKNLPNVLNSIIEPLISRISADDWMSGCGSCGDVSMPVSRYEINGRHHYLCIACAQKIEESLEENQQNMKSKKSQVVAGIVGAFLGALIGAVLWILIYRLGYIAGIAGAVTAICAFKGYEMFGKHLDRKGVFLCIIITIITIFFANRVAWAWEAYDALKSYGYSFTDSYRSLSEIIEASELTANYYGDLITGYLLTIVCSIGTIIRTFKNSAGSYTMKKMQ